MSNPYSSTRFSQALLAGDWANRLVAARAEFMHPEQAAYFNQWAKAHPTVNPRTWAPLAQQLIDPYSDEAMAVASEDIASQVSAGTYGKFIGQKDRKAPPPPPDPAETETEDGGGFWSTVTGLGGDALGLAGAGIQASADLVAGGPEVAFRGGQAGFEALYYGPVAEARTNLGAEDHRTKVVSKLAKAQGLNDAQRQDAQTFLVAEGASLVSPEQNAENVRAMIPTSFSPDEWESFLDTYVEAANAPELKEYLAGANQDFGKVAEQTSLGVIARSLTDGIKGNYLTKRPENGAVFDPKTKTWVMPDDGKQAQWVDHGGIFLPSELIQETGDAAIRAYDMRTAEDRKNNVSPVAWTLGRGVAHKFYSPEETGFSVMSGVVDFNASLFLDPTNLIPMGWAPDIVRAGRVALGNKTARAFSGYGDNVVVATRSQQFAGSKTLPSPLEGVRVGAREGVTDVLDDGSELIMDPVLAGRGYAIDGRRIVKTPDEAGRVNIPHGKYVAKQSAWTWLTTGKGSRAVEALAEMDSPMEIMLRSNRGFDGDLAVKLADATSPEEVRAVLAPRIGIDMEDARAFRSFTGISPALSKVPGISPGFLRGLSVAGAELEGSGIFTSRGRSAMARNYAKYGAVAAGRSLYRTPFRLAPTSGVGFDAEDIDSVFSEMERAFRGYRVADEKWIPAADKLIRAPNGIARYNAVYDKDGGLLKSLATTLTDEFGIDEQYADRLTQAFDSGLDEAKRMWVNKDLEAASYGAAEGTNGRVGRALLLNEMLSTRIYLPDYRSLRGATGGLAKLDKLPNGLEKTQMVTNYMTGVTSVWRDLVLMRPAYILRELGELAFSASLAGGKGAFTHPYAFIATSLQSMLAYEMQKGLTKLVTYPGRKLYGGAQSGVDAAARLMVTQGDERKAWQAAVNLPDHKKPDIIFGKNAEEVGKIYDDSSPSQRGELFWDSVDKKALGDYLLMQEGMQWFFPSVRSDWARVNGSPMWDELQKMADGQPVKWSPMMHELNQVAGPMIIDEPAVRGAARNVRTLTREDKVARRDYIVALIDSKFGPMANDAMMKRLARADANPEEILANWRHTSDWVLRREMRPDLWGKDKFPNKELSDVTVGDDFEYVTGYGNMLTEVTGSDRRLLDAIVDGHFEGGALDGKNAALVKHIDTLMADDAFRAQLPGVLSDIPSNMGFRGRYQGAVNSFFHTTGELSDVFGRSPLLRHFYTDFVVEHAHLFSPAARQQAVSNLRAAGDYKLAKSVLAAGRGDKAQKAGRGTLGIDEMEAAASGYARKHVGKAYYNAHRRQNYAVAMRILTPFIQATMNTFKRWGLMSLQNPQMAYRTLKPIEALREPGSAVIYEVLGDLTGDEAMQGMYSPGHPEASVDGFFFHNSYGDRVFGFPAVREIYNIMPLIGGGPGGGQDIPEGAVALANMGNLNVAGTTMNPGAGPMVTLPAALLTGTQIYQDNFEGKMLRGMFPYGLPEGGIPQKVFGALAPTAFRKAMVSPEQQANSTMKLLPTLAATGQYDLEHKSEVRRMIGDAQDLSSRMNWFSSIFGAVPPTTFNWDYAIDVSEGDKHGIVRTYMMADRLSEEWRRYTEPKSDATWQEDYSEGALNFIEDYGVNAFYAVMPRTEQPGTPITTAPTADIWAFRTENPDAYQQHRGVIGLFFPSGDPASEFGEAEENLYRWQTREDERIYKSPEDYWVDANTSLGWILYAAQNKKLMEQVTDPAAQTATRARLTDNVASKFPGWTGDPTDAGKFARGIEELSEAVEDPDIQTLPGTPFIGAYLDARDDLIDELRDLGQAGTLNADYAAPQRAKLAALASTLIVKDTSGTFSYAWSRFFAGELETE